MVYNTPELRLVGAAHTFVLDGRLSKSDGTDLYEPEIETFSLTVIEQPW